MRTADRSANTLDRDHSGQPEADPESGPTSGIESPNSPLPAPLIKVEAWLTSSVRISKAHDSSALTSAAPSFAPGWPESRSYPVPECPTPKTSKRHRPADCVVC
jgi:hypothetical protein